MKLRIAQMGDGMFEVQEERGVYEGDLCFLGWEPVGRYKALKHAQRRVSSIKESHAKQIEARTVVRVFE
jgi:hypothetical protein